MGIAVGGVGILTLDPGVGTFPTEPPLVTVAAGVGAGVLIAPDRLNRAKASCSSL
ncbi:MAG: hypothetical protein KME07_07250 [Pegethrix bostrychoides GSE-TBD4-15B]|uniref:Uncharacterized protein n=1 Tax=Pegethrix bostrychoides GSE-TBD4-15B TaxID=2839662 RepID=A0A951P9H9_9CYAN|nr:hypothetical protein [Pegethrix bostrychoides GSE-TBD4-15B]